jgi:hypothetical protein
LYLSIFCLIALSACTAAVQKPIARSDEAISDCMSLFEGLHSIVKAAGVQDGGAAQVKGFPYLRVDRFLATYRTEPMGSEQLAWWVGRMQHLDSQGRAIELANLPAEYRVTLPRALREPKTALSRLDECADGLMRRDLAEPTRVKRLRASATVPDDYRIAQRVLGLYPVTAIAFYQGVLKYQANTRATFATPLADLPVSGRMIVYKPSSATTTGLGSPAQILARSRDNPLGVPLPEGPDLDRLFAAHAPTLEVDQVDRNDRIGTPSLSRSGAARIDTSRPAMFVRIANARYQGEPLLQLVYSIWFPARPKTGKLDLLGGHLDSIIWRVTLGSDGEPLFYDTIHSCGCYHMFFPTPRVRLRPRRPAFEEPILVPARLGSRGSGERVVIRITSGTHYIQNVRYRADYDVDEKRLYEFVKDDELRSLPLPTGGRRSLYRSDGIVSGSQRGERYLYWPMGVREPGSMRQWGRHATAFVGRRHFDDPTLIEGYFEL